jgi:hypothetical protein
MTVTYQPASTDSNRGAPETGLRPAVAVRHHLAVPELAAS